MTPRLRVRTQLPISSLPMRLAFLLAMLLAAPLALGQGASVEDRYHEAARLYIDGRTGEARETATRALRDAPDHTRLRALLDLMQEQPPNGGDGDQPEDGPPQDDPDGAPEPGGDEPDEAEPDDAPPDSDQGREGDIGPEGDPRDDGQAGGEQPGPAAPGTLTPEEAERILRAIEADERQLLQDVQRRRAPARHTGPDW